MTANRLGIHAGVWGFDWSPRAAERAIGAAADIGYDLIEIPAIDRSMLDAAATRRPLERVGLASVVSLALTFADDISDGDAELSARGERRLDEAVTFAGEIGAPFVGGVIFGAMGRYDRLPTAAGRENALAVLRRVAARAARLGITLGVEYVNRYESNLLNTAEQTVRFLDDLGAENVVLHLDTFHAASEEISLPVAVATAGSRLGYIHASESHRGALGTGSTDWAAFVDALAGIGYTGALTVETFSSAVLSDDGAIDIGLWRPMWHDPDQVAADSLALLRARLAAAAVPTP